METILVPIDFSKCSIEALKFAADTARKAKAKLQLINVIQRQGLLYTETAESGDLENKFHDNLKTEITKKFDDLLKEPHLKDIETNYIIRVGLNIYKTICEEADESKADILIMGSRGLNGIKEILLGSNAQRVARFSGMPVLITPYYIQRMKTIVFASDFTEEAYKVFPAIQKFAGLFDAEIQLLKVNTYSEFRRTGENMELIKTFVRKFQKDYKIFIYDSYSKEDGILQYTNEIDADLIAMASHGKRGIGRFFRGDVSGGITRLTSRPVMLINFHISTKS